jgi:hypothetical protein
VVCFEFLSAAGGLVFGHLNNVIPAQAGNVPAEAICSERKINT